MMQAMEEESRGAAQVSIVEFTAIGCLFMFLSKVVENTHTLMQFSLHAIQTVAARGPPIATDLDQMLRSSVRRDDSAEVRSC